MKRSLSRVAGRGASRIKASVTRKRRGSRIKALFARSKVVLSSLLREPEVKEYAEKQAKLIKETLDSLERKFKKRIHW